MLEKQEREGRPKGTFPYYSTVLSAVMALVILLATPWGVRLRGILFESEETETWSTTTAPGQSRVRHEGVSRMDVVPQHGVPGSGPPDSSTGGRPAAALPSKVLSTDVKARQAAPSAGTEDMGGGDVVVEPAGPAEALPHAPGVDFLVLINGEPRIVASGQTVDLRKGDTLVLQDVLPSGPDPSKIKVNLVGFVGSRIGNPGEDRGYEIRTDRLLPHRSLHGKGRLYKVIAAREGRPIGRIFVRIVDRPSGIATSRGPRLP